jgi:hypothetical protein
MMNARYRCEAVYQEGRREHWPRVSVSGSGHGQNTHPVSTVLPFLRPLVLLRSLRRPQYVSRKTLAIKRGDSEILTRNDIQYAFLYHVFNDKTLAFTDENPGNPPTKVTFCNLYVHALYNSSKCSKVMRDKMLETPDFAVEFAKISLLTNVGRINTTMACMRYRTTSLFPPSLKTLSSLSRDENCPAELSPSSLSPKNEWECTRCSQNQKLSQGCFLTRRAEVGTSLDAY